MHKMQSYKLLSHSKCGWSSKQTKEFDQGNIKATVIQCDQTPDDLCKLAKDGYPTHVAQKCDGDRCETTFVKAGFMPVDQLKKVPELSSFMR